VRQCRGAAATGPKRRVVALCAVFTRSVEVRCRVRVLVSVIAYCPLASGGWTRAPVKSTLKIRVMGGKDEVGKDACFSGAVLTLCEADSVRCR
jgi:hypothetical protein